MINPALRPHTRPFNKTLVELLHPFYYGCIEHQVEIEVPKKFRFDGFSAPRGTWNIIGSPFLPRNIGPGLVHDYLYRTGCDKHGNKVSRKTADLILDHCLMLNGVPKWRRFLVHKGLRAGGWVAWRKHRSKD